MISAEGSGACYWLTGLSGAGKTTLATAARKSLSARGIHGIVLDGDVLRNGVCKDVGFGREGRRENIRRIAEIAAVLVAQDFIVFAATISPYREDRAAARDIFEDGRFFEVHVSTRIDICQQRDPKKLYARALRGEIPDFTGVSSPYEAPLRPDLAIDAGSLTPAQSAAVLEAYVLEMRCA